jgi:hypothetical protein
MMSSILPLTGSRVRTGSGPCSHSLWQVLLFLLLFLAIPGILPASREGAADDMEDTIQYLVDYVAGSGLTFIRNGSSHPAPEAAEHMNTKYQNLKSRVNSPEDFIELCATRSLMTGRPYEVVTADGKTRLTGEWLRQKLDEYRSQQGMGEEQPDGSVPGATIAE